MNTNNGRARVAGFFYLMFFVAAITSDLWRDSFIVLGDAAATASNIRAQQGLFAVTAVGDLVTAALFFLAAWALYVLLKPVNRDLALLFMLLNLAGVAVHFTSGLNLFAALLLLNGPDYLNVFQPDQLQALAMFSLDLQHKGFSMAQLFYGLWLFPLGYTVYRSGFLPRVLGIVLMIHCFTWTSTFFQVFLFPGFEALHYVSWPLGFIAEGGLTLWLLGMGAKNKNPQELGLAGRPIHDS
ncbi:MAG: DUF4386 domain-containing protein [Chloroflexota bacterium]